MNLQLLYPGGPNFSSSHVWCESWTIKKAEQKRDTFELQCWERLLRGAWTTKRSNEFILKETSPEYSLENTEAETEAPILWPPDAKKWHTGKDPDAGKDWKQEQRRTTENKTVGISSLMDMSFSKLQDLVMNREAWCAAVHGVTKSRTEWLNWTREPIYFLPLDCFETKQDDDCKILTSLFFMLYPRLGTPSVKSLASLAGERGAQFLRH